MAIEKTTPIGNTGVEGNYWTCSDFRIVGTPDPHRGPAGVTRVIGTYRMWVNKAAHASGKSPMTRARSVTVDVSGIDPKLSEIAAAFETELLRPSIEGRPAIQEVVAQPAVKAKTAVEGRDAVEADSDKGIPAKPAVAAQAAVAPRGAIKAVKAQAAVQAVRGGQLEGGKVV